MNTSRFTTLAALTGMALVQVEHSPQVQADRLARSIESRLWVELVQGKHPHVEYTAVTEARKVGLPPELVIGHPVIQALASLERMG